MEATMQKKKATDLLYFMISALIRSLKELSFSSSSDDNLFCYGEKTAYVECLEWIQQWENAEAYGLDFDVEARFPL